MSRIWLRALLIIGLLIACLKISATIERIGDLAKNIARRAIHLSHGRQSSVTNSMVLPPSLQPAVMQTA